MRGKMSGEIGQNDAFQWPNARRWSGVRARIIESERLKYLLGDVTIVGPRTRWHRQAEYLINRSFA
jgi:hypothetical protein